MAEFKIHDSELIGLKGKVVVLTGGSSGIGLDMVNLLLSLGALVINGDIQSPPVKASTTQAFTFVRTNVTIWEDLVSLFEKAKEHHGRIDHVFANAGIGPRADYLEIQADENGNLKEPTSETLDVNLKSVINTACLAFHFMKQQVGGGSIVLMGSSTALQPLRVPDYSTSKHGVLGFGRGYARLIEAAGFPVRVNVLAPSWTSTQLLPDVEGNLKAIGYETQSALVVARAAALLMVDEKRNGEVIYVADGKYKEIEKAVLAPAYESIKGYGSSDDEILRRLIGNEDAGSKVS